MVNVGSLQPPLSVEEVIGAGPIPAELIGVLLDRFCISGEDDGALSTDNRSGRPLHAFLGHPSSWMDPVLGF